MERENDIKVCRIHRVGTVTAGMGMVVFGILFLLNTLFDLMSYQVIFSLWPILLIGLGIELLLSNLVKSKIVYDKTAVFLLIVMTFFVMGLACADVCMEASRIYWQGRI